MACNMMEFLGFFSLKFCVDPLKLIVSGIFCGTGNVCNMFLHQMMNRRYYILACLKNVTIYKVTVTTLKNISILEI